jgi:CRISPR system Cascade subunit CasE
MIFPKPRKLERRNGAFALTATTTLSADQASTQAANALRTSLGPATGIRLTANPVRSGRSKPADTRTRRFGHVTVAQQRDWLLSRSKLAGFTVPVGELGESDVIVHNRMTHTFRRQNGKVTIQSATYDGRLEVADPDALRRTLTLGLGHAKAYGCGLLTLAPVRRNP